MRPSFTNLWQHAKNTAITGLTNLWQLLKKLWDLVSQISDSLQKNLRPSFTNLWQHAKKHCYTWSHKSDSLKKTVRPSFTNLWQRAKNTARPGLTNLTACEKHCKVWSHKSLIACKKLWDLVSQIWQHAKKHCKTWSDKSLTACEKHCKVWSHKSLVNAVENDTTVLSMCCHRKICQRWHRPLRHLCNCFVINFFLIMRLNIWLALDQKICVGITVVPLFNYCEYKCVLFDTFLLIWLFLSISVLFAIIRVNRSVLVSDQWYSFWGH